MKIRVGARWVDIERISEDVFLVDGRERRVDAALLARGVYSLIIDDRPVVVEITGEGDHFEVLVDHEHLTVDLVPPKQEPKEEDVALIDGEAVIQSPMPGHVVAITVKPQQQVQKGDGLIIVESMKMENELTSPVDGRVSKVEVEVGEPIQSHQPLLTIKPN